MAEQKRTMVTVEQKEIEELRAWRKSSAHQIDAAGKEVSEQALRITTLRARILELEAMNQSYQDSVQPMRTRIDDAEERLAATMIDNQELVKEKTTLTKKLKALEKKVKK